MSAAFAWDRPIIVIGAGRSGSTLVSAIIVLTRNIAAANFKGRAVLGHIDRKSRLELILSRLKALRFILDWRCVSQKRWPDKAHAGWSSPIQREPRPVALFRYD